MGKITRAVTALLVLSCLTACSLVDLGTRANEPSWDWRKGWRALPGPVQTTAPTGNKYDADGNLIPSPEVQVTYALPDIHGGTAILLGSTSRITPTISIEAAEVKVPFARWWILAVGTGEDLGMVYAGKRLTSVYEISVGPFWGRDFRENESTWGVQFTLLKF